MWSSRQTLLFKLKSLNSNLSRRCRDMTVVMTSGLFPWALSPWEDTRATSRCLIDWQVSRPVTLSHAERPSLMPPCFSSPPLHGLHRHSLSKMRIFWVTTQILRTVFSFVCFFTVKIHSCPVDRKKGLWFTAWLVVPRQRVLFCLKT